MRRLQRLPKLASWKWHRAGLRLARPARALCTGPPTPPPAQHPKPASSGAGSDQQPPEKQNIAQASERTLNAAGELEEGEFPADGEIPPEVYELFDTLRGEALRRLDEFQPIHLFSMCWAYSTARMLDDELRARIVGAAFRLGRRKDRDPFAGRRKLKESPAHEVDRVSEDNQPRILAEGKHWMVFYKPPNWQVTVDSKEAAKQAATAAPFEDDAEGEGEDDALQGRSQRPRLHVWIRQNLAKDFPICSDPVEAFGLLHRLDQQTSGILMCAKSYVGAFWLRLQWCSYVVCKEYVCLVHGWVDPSIREVHKRIRVDKRKAPNSRRTISTHCSIADSGKPSYTELVTLAHLHAPSAELLGDSAANDDEEERRFSLVALKLHTGRTHQIRVHMLSLGHPLVTDSKYADERVSVDRVWCSRNFLHTYHLGFHEPPEGAETGPEPGAALDPAEEALAANKGERVDVYCPLPSDLRDALSRLKAKDAESEARVGAWLAGDSKELKSFAEWTVDVRGDEPEATEESSTGAS